MREHEHPVAVPGECPRRLCAFVPRRPLPLAQVAFPAPGGAPIAPPLSRFFGDFLAETRKFSIAVPGSFLGANAVVTCRPQLLAQVASSATGGAPIAPPHGVAGRNIFVERVSKQSNKPKHRQYKKVTARNPHPSAFGCHLLPGRRLWGAGCHASLRTTLAITCL